MNYSLYLIFLLLLSVISLLALALYHILDSFNVSAKQKLTLLKVGTLMIFIAPIFYVLLRCFSLSVIEITLPASFGVKVSDHAVHTAPFVSQIHWSFYAFAVYCGGLIVMLSRVLFSYISAKRRLAGSVPTEIQGHLVNLNNNIQSPLSFGFPVAKIYLPADAESRWSTREIQLSLAHEQSHIDRFDSIWKLISLIVQAMLFFAPWSYLLHKKHELEMEIYCDESTCAQTGANLKEYGSLLLAMSCIQPHNSIFTNITDSTLKRRLVAMKARRIRRPFLMSLFSALIITVCSAAVAMAGGINGMHSVFKISTNIYMDGHIAASPSITVQANHKAVIVMADNTMIKDNHFSAIGHVLRVETTARNVAGSGSHDPIDMQYDVQYQNGKENIHFKPHMKVLPNQEGTVSFSSESGHIYELRVTAERV